MKNLFYLTILTIVTAVEIPRPRGVSLTKSAFYNPDVDFKCLDGSMVVPYKYVNDDFCDCGDGSDEPGTSACPNGIFHCTNAGHRPRNIPSSRVNDGICDCCDASDEYNSSTQCSNTCKELGRKAREDALRLADIVTKGYQIRLELAQNGKQKKIELQQQLESLNKQKQEADTIKIEKEALKSAAEELEKSALDKLKAEEDEQKKLEEEAKEAEKFKEDATEAFHNLDANQDGKITFDEIQEKWVFDTDKDGIVTKEEALFYMAGKDDYDLQSFIEYGWIIVKPHYSMLNLFKPPEPSELEPDSQIVEHSESSQEPPVEQPPSAVEEEEAKDDEIDDDDENTEYDPEPLKEEETQSPYDPETQQLIDDAKVAREDFDKANKALLDLERQIKDTQHILEIEYGEEDQFAPLYGECIEYTDREYVYKLCFFDSVTQKPKSGGSDVNLGRWGRWSGNEDKFSQMKYENGLSCWNGPTRSTEVKLSCGVENQILSVSEPNRCIYIMEVETPAVCIPIAGEKSEHMHEEL